MSQTLRRQLIQTITKILSREIKYWEGHGEAETLGDISENIADDILKLRAFKQEPAYDKSQADPAWEILFGNRTQADVDHTQFMEDAIATFERDLKLPVMNWYPNRRAEEAAMAVLRNLVITEFKKDRSIFQKYETWRRQPFSRGAVSNVTITRTPEQFVSSWSDFRAANPEVKPRVETSTDEDGIPETY